MYMERLGCYKSGKFFQRMCEFYNVSKGLSSNKVFCLAATASDAIYAGTDSGLDIIEKDGSVKNFKCGEVKVACAVKDGAYFACGNILYKAQGGECFKVCEFSEPVTGISSNDSHVYLITASMLYKLENGAFTPYCGTESAAEGLSVTNDAIVSYSGRSLMVFAGKRKHWMCIFPEHSTMPRFKINSVTFDEKLDFVWLGTDKGAFIYDNSSSWFGHSEIDSLPEEEVYNISFAKNGRVLLSTEAGLVIIKDGASKYLPAKRWVCEEKVNDAIAVGGDIWTATDSGISRIYEKETTLEKKAEESFELAEKYYIREPGFITGLNNVSERDHKTGSVAITDNDGLWTQTYVGALSFAYAVTGDEKYLNAARRSMKACALLTKITGIKGFTARAVRFSGEEGFGTGLEEQLDGGEWHKSGDPDCEWLGETSSDEMTGHFFGFSAYYDFCADDKEKESIKEIICDIVDHILENGYRLCDIDGLPTTWACWAPSELNGKSMWNWEKCINSLEILTFLSVAYHVSGNEKYRKEYLRLAKDEHYLLNAAQHKKADGRVTHIDDNLGFLCSLTILRLEDDPRIRSYILMGLRHHWDYERAEHCSFFNLVYGAFGGEVCDVEYAVKALRDVPADFTYVPFFNGKRKNLEIDTEPELWGGEKQFKEALPLDERNPHNFDTNPYTISGGKDRGAQSPSCYLLPYWFGRYYGVIE